MSEAAGFDQNCKFCKKFFSTGKTTCLAAAVLSHVAAGHRVLVVTPSHAACDAITLALAEHWPGDARGQVVRLGNKLRLTSRHVSRFLPEHVATCRQLEEVEQQLAWVRRQLLDSLEDRSEPFEPIPHKKLHLAGAVLEGSAGI